MKRIKTYEQLMEGNPCWSGYKQVGTKKKDGKIVPNCVPVVEEADSESGPMGFVFSFVGGNRDEVMTYTVAGVYDDFYDFAIAMQEDLCFSPRDEDDEDYVPPLDIYAIAEDILEANEFREFEWSFWHGLIPKPGARPYESVKNLNAYKVMEMLDKQFVNSKEIMGGSDKKKHTENDPSYIANSISRTPEMLSHYEGEGDYEKIVKALKWDKKKIDAILKINRIKNQF